MMTAHISLSLVVISLLLQEQMGQQRAQQCVADGHQTFQIPNSPKDLITRNYKEDVSFVCVRVYPETFTTTVPCSSI